MKKIKFKKEVIIKRIIPLTLVFMLLVTTFIGVIASVSSLFSQNNIVGSYGEGDDGFIEFDEYLKQLEAEAALSTSSETSAPTETTSSETSTPTETASSETSAPTETTSSETSTPTETASSETSAPTETVSSETSAPTETVSSETSAPTETASSETSAPTETASSQSKAEN